MKDQILSELKDILELDDIDENAKLEEFNLWDSLAQLSLASAIEDNFQIEIDEGTLSNFVYVKDIFDYLDIK